MSVKKKPLVVVTRKLPDSIETRMRELFDARLNLDDTPMTPEQIAEAARTLKPGGRLLITDLQPHEQAEYRQTMGHQWLGFSESAMRGWMQAAGLRQVQYHALSPDASARGPMLFTAVGLKR